MRRFFVVLRLPPSAWPSSRSRARRRLTACRQPSRIRRVTTRASSTARSPARSRTFTMDIAPSRTSIYSGLLLVRPFASRSMSRSPATAAFAAVGTGPSGFVAVGRTTPLAGGASSLSTAGVPHADALRARPRLLAVRAVVHGRRRIADRSRRDGQLHGAGRIRRVHRLPHGRNERTATSARRSRSAARASRSSAASATPTSAPAALPLVATGVAPSARSTSTAPGSAARSRTCRAPRRSPSPTAASASTTARSCRRCGRPQETRSYASAP